VCARDDMCERLDLFIAKDAWRDDVADGDSAKVSPRVGVRAFYDYDGACLQLAFICACWRLPRALLPLLNLLKPGKSGCGRSGSDVISVNCF
jgi:hypothetical protein